MDSLVTGTWSKIIAWIEKRAPLLAEELQANGDQEHSWATFEAALGTAVPEELKAFYRLHNGQANSSFGGLFFGMRLLSFEQIIDHWEEWASLDLFNEAFEDEMTSEPVGVIKPIYSNPLWIPFTTDGHGNHIGIDLDPDERGCHGQVIIFGHEEHQKKLIANSLVHFLSLYWVQLSTSGNFYRHNNSIYFDDDLDIHYHDRYSSLQQANQI